MREPRPRKFKMHHIDTFNDSTDPLDHLETYKNFMMLQAVPDEIMCKAFPVTLRGSGRVWFNKIKPHSIGSFKELNKKFVEAVEDQVSIAAFIAGLNSGQLLFSLTKEPPITIAKLMLGAQKHMNAKDPLNARRSMDDNVDLNPYQTGQREQRKKEPAEMSKDSRVKRPEQRGPMKTGGTVVSTYQLKMKFPVGEGIGEVRGSQQAVWECYNCTLKNSKETPIEIYTVENLDVRDEDKLVQGEPVEDLVKLELEPG
ncbi:hypothetical protein Vadar_000067 [Vaccinium darrowii]|uniref:Uncharacterized protein n=1 Tax=Vaccinium darrowii TaxID=229202 RepID=A0ACB7ZGG5_9ERIC|nr:hypothetical protein Vadar_000067 [Vaccinium darrowii]